MRTEILNVCDRLVTGSLNGIYQGMIVAVLVALTLRLLRRTNAATRHAVWFCTLLVLVSLMAAHCLRPYLAPGASSAGNTTAVPAAEAELGSVLARSLPEADESKDPVVAAEGTRLTPPVPEASVSLDQETISAQSLLLAEEKPGSWRQVDVSTGVSEPAIQTSAINPALVPGQAQAPSGSRSAMDSVLEPPTANVLSPAPPAGAGTSDPDVPTVSAMQMMLRRVLFAAANPISWNLAPGLGIPRSASLLLLAGWLSLAGLRVFALLWRLQRIRRLKQGSSPASGDLNNLFQSLRTRLAGNRKVELRVSIAHRSAVLLGFIHPVILLPATETGSEAEPVLRHELAHVRRRDDWANLIQHFIQAAFFVHPAVGWISKRLSLEREIACDDHVLHQSGRPRAYALLLANLAGRMQGGPPLLAPGVSANKSQLQQRIDMILNTKRNTSPRLAKTRLGFITSVAALLAIAAIYAAPRVVLAQNETPPPAAEGDAVSADVAVDVNADVTADVATDVSVTPEVSVVAVLAPTPPTPDALPPEAPGTPEPAAVGSGPKAKSGGPKAFIVRTPGSTATFTPFSTASSFSATTPVAPVAPVPPPTPYAVTRSYSLAGPVATPAPMAVIVAPTPPTPPSVIVATTEPAEPALPPVPPRAARPGRAPHAGNVDGSLEQRLDRLEKMLESLMAQQNAKPGQSQFKWEWRSEQDARKKSETSDGTTKPLGQLNPKELGKLKELSLINPEQLGRIKEYAARQAEYAKRQAEFAQRQAEMAQREVAGAADQARQAAREAEKAMSADQKRQTQEKFKQGAQKKLEGLRRQIEILERQREKLDRQIEQLEQDQEQLDEQGDEQGDDDQPRSEAQPEQSKEKCIAQKTAAG